MLGSEGANMRSGESCWLNTVPWVLRVEIASSHGFANHLLSGSSETRRYVRDAFSYGR